MKKMLLIVLSILIIIGGALIAFNVSPRELTTDSGFDSSYDSGGSSDWGDSGYSSYSSSSGNGSSSSLILVIIVVVIIIIVAEKSKNKGNNSYIALNHSKEISDLEISKVIPGFVRDEFLHNRYLDYLEIQRAWMNFDYESLRKRVTDELYNQYTMQLDSLKINNQRNIMLDFIYIDSMITDIKKEEETVVATLELVVEFIDFIERNGSVVRGNNNRKISMHYRMTFVSNINNQLEKCPNCGAPLGKEASKRCEYCNSIISSISNDWVMSKKEGISQR